MTRNALLAVALVGAVVIPASQASAKGITYAHFSGAGLPSGGVTVSRGDLRELRHTGLLEPKGKALASLGLSRRDLGPAYRAEYRMDYAPRATLHQVVYPYAQGGPITFTPRGQHIGHDYESFRGGWYAAESSLLAYLIAHGFPRSDPSDHVDRLIPAEEGAQTTPASSVPWSWSIGVAVTAALGGAVALVVRRSRDRGSMKPQPPRTSG